MRWIFAILLLLVMACSIDTVSSLDENIAAETDDLWTENDVVRDTITDSRDGKKYEVVKIGNQWWMAENLDYVLDSSFCYNDELDSCEIYGRLYTWDVAMNLDRRYLTDNAFYYEQVDSVHQGICPDNWHIPTKSEWRKLIEFMEFHNGDEGSGASIRTPYGWVTGKGEWADDYSHKVPVESVNRFGFAALPGGARATRSLASCNCYSYEDSRNNLFCGHAYFSFFWSATEDYSYRNNTNYAAFVTVNGMMNSGGVYIYDNPDKSKDWAMSVRCVKN